jgi:transcriptional regulator with XRE-family HTH domain
MFPNLRAEMARKGLDGIDISARLGCTPKTFSSKMNGKSEFTRAEIFRIRNEFFPNLTIEYLFQTEQSQHTA